MTLPEGIPNAVRNEEGATPLHFSPSLKLAVATTLLVFLSLAGLYILTDALFKKHLTAETEAGLRGEAAAVRESLLLLPGPLASEKVDALVDGIGSARPTRTTVIREDGTVLGDSMVSGEALGEMKNQTPRPEIGGALERGHGRPLQKGGSSGTDTLYVAEAFETGSGEKIVVRVALPLASMEVARSRLRDRFAIAATVILATLAALLVQECRLARRGARDLQRMGRAADAFGRGVFDVDIPIEGEDAIGELGRSLFYMRERLDKSTRRTENDRNRLQEILDAMQEGVLMLDSEGRVIQINPALRRLFDLPPKPIGRRVIELIRATEFQELISEGVSGSDTLVRELTLRRSGMERQVLVRLAQVKKQGRPSGAVVFFNDVTDTRRLEKMRSDFIANVSHEIKTPLTAIRGYAETLAQAPPENPAQADVFINTILRHANRLGALVDDLLELSRIESGEAILKIEPVPLNPCAKRVLQGFELIARQRKLTLEASLPASLPPLMADASALETILSNLVENAVKYTDEGGRVGLRARSARDGVQIEVADTGPGIAPEDLSRLFERFYRVDPSRSREQGGTGLGLAIVKHLSQALGGHADVRSTPGEGSVFSVTLPVADTGNPEESA